MTHKRNTPKFVYNVYLRVLLYIQREKEKGEREKKRYCEYWHHKQMVIEKNQLPHIIGECKVYMYSSHI